MESAVFLTFFGAIFARQEVFFLLFLKVCCCAPVCELPVESNRKDVRKSLVDAWQLSEILTNSSAGYTEDMSCYFSNEVVKL